MESKFKDSLDIVSQMETVRVKTAREMLKHIISALNDAMAEPDPEKRIKFIEEALIMAKDTLHGLRG